MTVLDWHSLATGDHEHVAEVPPEGPSAIHLDPPSWDLADREYERIWAEVAELQGGRP